MECYLTEPKRWESELEAAEMAWRDGYEHTEPGPVMLGKEPMLPDKI